jgi:uncharacterized protein YprB with RNaseH-like and TPR domain
MLESSFIHIPGIGPITEQRIWERGVHDWRALLRRPAAAGLSARLTQRVTEAAALSLDRLQHEDHRYFAAALPPREQWRAFPEFSHCVAYLDIETTGMSDEDAVTMIGVYDGSRTRTYVRGEDLDEFADDVGRYRLLVTFFGGAFDLPFLRRRFPSLVLDQLHIDLCPVLHRLGYKGGLKAIERQLGLSRSAETDGLGGWDAVRLWHEWRRGSREALALLKAYNTEDIVHLEALLEFAYPRLRRLAGFPVAVQ